MEDVLVVDVNGEPWFVARDVCECLELTNTSQTLSYLDADEKGITTNDTPGGHVPDEWKGRNWIMTPGGEQEMLIISEQGLYFFLGRSDKPKALPYQTWVVEDVNGEPWFVAKDVCECLELGNPRTSIALLDEDEKGVHTMDTPTMP